MKKFIQSWLIGTLAVLVASYIVKGIHYETWVALIVASLVLGIFNTVLRPLLMLISLPLLVFTLGLFRLVINAFLLYFVGFLLRPHFYVDTFWNAFWGALLISIVTLSLNALTGNSDSRVRVIKRTRPPGSGPDQGGPVIDI